MTRSEFAEYFNVLGQKAKYYFDKAGLIYPEIKKKNQRKSVRCSVTDYTLDEILKICECSKDLINPILQETLKEDFHKYDHGGTVYKENEKSIYIDGMEDFINSPQKKKCCETCQYLTGSRIMGKGSQIHPYCNFYNIYLGYKNNIKIFEDYCKTYDRAESPYRLWYNETAPSGLPSFIGQSSVPKHPLSLESE